MLCLDSESDLKYCLDAARGKKSLLQAPVVLRCPSLRGVFRCWNFSFPWVPFIHTERSEDAGAIWLVVTCTVGPCFLHAACQPSGNWCLLASNLEKIPFQLMKPPAPSASIPKWMACLTVEGFLQFSLHTSFSFSLLLLLSLLGGTPS